MAKMIHQTILGRLMRIRPPVDPNNTAITTLSQVLVSSCHCLSFNSDKKYQCNKTHSGTKSRKKMGHKDLQFKAGLAIHAHPMAAIKPVKRAIFLAAIVCGSAQTTSKTTVARKIQPQKNCSSRRRKGCLFKLTKKGVWNHLRAGPLKWLLLLNNTDQALLSSKNTPK